ncbi:hypothetical protein MMC30_000428 [Trapelia coarctata]|nr:hypothetical protein [Trapelia coarctata]
MDAAEPDQTPFSAVTAQTSRFSRAYQAYLDKSTPYVTYRWVGTGALLLVFMLRIVLSEGWYIALSFLEQTLPYSLRKTPTASSVPPNSSPPPLAKFPSNLVCYSLGIYLLNLFLAFLQPKFDPSLTQAEGLEDGDSQRSPLPTTRDEEFRPFIRRLPEFKFWYSATRAVFIGFLCTWFEVFNVPVFWPVLVVYWIILFTLTMRRQIQHMIKYRYVPFSFGKAKYNSRSGH